jgi:hypothetical protein
VRLIILLATLSIALPFVISQAAMPFSIAVSERFLERPTSVDHPRYTIPTETAAGDALNENSLTKWVGSQSRLARGYARRIILLDVAYLLLPWRVYRHCEHHADRLDGMAGDISSYFSLGLLALACALHSLRLRRRHTYLLDAQLAVNDKGHGFHCVDRLPNHKDGVRHLGFGPGSAALSPLIYLVGGLEILSVSSPGVRRIANHS